MKKIIILILSVMMLSAIAMFTFGACDCGGDDPHTHTYSQTWEKNETKHWHKATCGHNVKKDEADHSFVDDVCSVCGYEKAHEHTFAPDWTQNDTNHWHAATCGHDVKKDDGAHTFENGVCSVCGYSQAHQHTFDTQLTYDEDSHWYPATCGHAVKNGEAPHSLNANGDCECGYHVHQFSSSWEKDDTNHWHPSTCGHDVKNEFPHALDENGDCECGYHEHIVSSDWVHDENKHWHYATCGHEVKIDEAKHSYENNICTECGYILQVAHDHTFSDKWSNDNDYHWHSATCEHTSEIRDKEEHLLVNGTCICGYHEHQYSSDWEKDAMFHWHAATCEHDTEVSDKVVHNFNGTDTCIECGYVKVTTEHTHTFSDLWTYDANGHWHMANCEHTTVQSEKIGHTLVNGTCECGYHVHQYSGAWENDAIYHWHVATCEHDTEILGKALHNYGDDNVCDDCQYEKQEYVHEHTFSSDFVSDPTGHWHVATCEHTNLTTDKVAHNLVDGTCECGYHVHQYSEEYDKDNTFHWLKTACGHDDVEDALIKVGHDFTNGDCVCGQPKPAEEQGHSHTVSTEWTKDATSHWKMTTCDGHEPIAVEKANHNLVNGTCECGYHEHQYSTELGRDENYHWFKTTCGHDAVDGVLIKEGHTFETISSTVKECSVCKYKVTYAHEHTFSDEWEYTDTHHYHPATCEHAVISGEAEHVLVNGTCECGYHQHQFAEDWTYDDTHHWHAALCADGIIEKFGHEFDEETNACVCGLVKVEEHQHTFSTEWMYDGNNHWHPATCEHTSEWSDFGEHTLFNGTCYTCGYHEHTYSVRWSYDDEFHWHETTCGHSGVSVKQGHTYNADNVCTVCNLEKVNDPVTNGNLLFVTPPKQLVVGESAMALTKYPFISEDLKPTYSSSDTNVVTIDANGVMTAIRPGSATIRGYYQGGFDKFTVSVITDGLLPSLGFEGIISDNGVYQIPRNGKLNLSAFVIFNGKTFDDADITYTSSNTELGSFDADGVYTAGDALGETTITISAEWREIYSPTLSLSIKVKVIADAQFILNDGKANSIDIYTVQSHGGNTYNTSLELDGFVKALCDGEDYTDTLTYKLVVVNADGSISDYAGDAIILDGTNVLYNANSTYDKNLKVKLQATMTTGDGDISQLFDVNVQRPVATVSTSVKLFSQMDGDIKGLQTIIGEGKIITDAYQNGDYKAGRELTVAEGAKLTDVTRSILREVSLEKVVIYTDDNVGYELTLETYTKVINTVEDFLVFDIYNDYVLIDGIYVLGQDIFSGDLTIEHKGLHSRVNTSFQNTLSGTYRKAGFAGVFDGLGHKVRFTLTSGAGLFGLLQNDAVIRNVAFYEMKLKQFDHEKATDLNNNEVSIGSAKSLMYTTMFAYTTSNNARTTYSDVYVHILSATDAEGNTVSNNVSGLVYRVSPYDEFDNVLVKFDVEFDKTAPNAGALAAARSTTNLSSERVRNLLVISESPLISLGGNTCYVTANSGIKDGDKIGDTTYYVIPGATYGNYAKIIAAGTEGASVVNRFTTSYWNVVTHKVPVFASMINVLSQEVVLSTDTVELTPAIADSAKITVFSFNKTDSVQITAQPDETVATADVNGNISIVSIGSTFVTYTVGEKSATLQINSNWHENKAPVPGVQGISADTLNLTVNDAGTLVAQVSYAGSTFTKAEASAKGLTDISFKAVKQAGADFTVNATTGAYTAPASPSAGYVEVTAKFYNQEVKYQFAYDVFVELDPVVSEVPTLYTTQEFDGKQYAVSADVSIDSGLSSVKITNVEVDNPAITFALSSGSTVGGQTINGKVSVNTEAPEVGTFHIKVTYSTTINGEPFTSVRNVPVVVDRPEAKDLTATATVILSKNENKLYGLEAIEELKGLTFVEGYNKSNPSTVYTISEDLVVNGFITDRFDGSGVSVVLCTPTVRYQVMVKGATEVLTKLSDFSIFQQSTTNKQDMGYYYVANDIAYDDNWKPNEIGGDGANTDSFAGTFDGGGHTIEYSIKQSGLFGYLSGSAVIKNAAFIVKDYKGTSATYAGYAALASTTMQSSNVTLENVYVAFDMEDELDLTWSNGQSSGLALVEKAYASMTIKNVIIDISRVKIKQSSNPAFAYGSVFARNSYMQKDAQTSNLYVVSPFDELGYQARRENGIVLEERSHAVYASNRSDLYEAIQETETTSTVYLLKNAYHFSSVAELRNYFVTTGASAFELFNKNVWNTTDYGMPVINSDAMIEYHIKTSTLTSLNDETTDSIAIDASKGVTTVNINMIVNGTTYDFSAEDKKFTITTKSGSISNGEGEVATLNGNVLTIPIGAAGVQYFELSVTYQGVTVVKNISVYAQLPTVESEVWFSTKSNEAMFTDASKLEGVTKIVDFADKNKVYYENGAFNVDAFTENLDATSSNIGEYVYPATVYIDGAATYMIDVVSYTMVIDSAEDLTYVYGEANEIIEGYFIVANDIKYDAENPVMLSPKTNTYFNGTFDGDGHLIEYGTNGNGIFGVLGSNGATKVEIKNATLVVKAFGTDDTVSNYKYSLLAYSGITQWSKQMSISNVYFKYDIANFAPNVKFINGASSSGLGLFGAGAAYVNYSNVIIDMTMVQGVAAEYGEQLAFAFGALSAGSARSSQYSTFKNTHVYWENPLVGFARKSDNGTITSTVDVVVLAENDLALSDAYMDKYSLEFTGEIGKKDSDTAKYGIHVLAGLNRFSGYAEAADYFKTNNDLLQAFSFVDITDGYPFVGTKADAVASDTRVLINGEETSSYAIDYTSSQANIPVVLNYNGSNVSGVEIKHYSGATLVDIDGNNISFTAGTNDEFGIEVLEVKATINGVEVIKYVTFTAELQYRSDVTIKYSSMDNTGYLPDDLTNVTKIARYSDTSVVYFDGLNWTENPLQNEGSAATDLLGEFTEEVVVYRNGVPAFKANIVSYTMIITKASDLASLYSESATSAQPVDGYFLVAEDIDYEKDPFTANPGSSYFAGTLDGQGHTIEYAIAGNGLLGTIVAPFEIKDVSFVVKGIDNPETLSIGKYSIIAYSVSGLSWGKTSKISNVYAKYEVEDFTPNVKYNRSGQTSGLGLFVYTPSYIVYTNVVVDMTSVKNVKTSYGEGIEEMALGFGAFGSNNVTSIQYSTFNNSYVMWDVPYATYKASADSTNGYQLTGKVEGITIAESDIAMVDSLKSEFGLTYGGVDANGNYNKDNTGDHVGVFYSLHVLKGLVRFSSYSDAKAYFAQTENADKLNAFSWADTKDGYPFVGDKALVVDGDTKLTVNGEFIDSYTINSTDSVAELVAGLEFAGVQQANVVVTHKSGANLVTITDNNKISFTAGDKDGFGQEVLAVTATINGVEITKTFTFTVNLPKTEAVITYSTMDNLGTIPSELANVTKIVKFSDISKVVYDGENWNSANVFQNVGENAVENLANATESVIIYQNGVATYRADIVSYTKIITKGSDLQALRNSANTTKANSVQGYFIVANDIDYEKDAYNVSNDSSSYFGGVLDGQGHTVEFGVDKYGLLGGLGNNAEIKNISLVLKNITSSANYGVYPILAHNSGAGVASARAIITDAYFAYDIPDFAPSTTWTNAQSNGIGLFGDTSPYVTYTNVMVDMSGVPALDYGYGAFGTWNANNVVYSTFVNTYVIYEKECLAYARNSGTDSSFRYGHFAENDREAANAFATTNNVTISDSGSKVKNQLIVMKGVHRFDDVAAAMAYFKLEENAGKLEAFEGFTDTSMGYPFVGDKESTVDSNVTVRIAGQDTTTYSTQSNADVSNVEVALIYNGQPVENVTLTHASGKTLAVISENKLSFTAGSGFGSETITATATVEGVQVKKTITFNANLAELASGEHIMYSSMDAESGLNAVVLPEELEDANITKIEDFSDSSVVYYSEGAFSNIPLNMGENANSDLTDFTKTGAIYVDGVPTYKVELVSYTKIIKTYADLATVRSSNVAAGTEDVNGDGTVDAGSNSYENNEANRINGYFIVANDIVADDSWTPDRLLNDYYAKGFCGVFDGQGYTIEYNLVNVGLFGHIGMGAVVKNATLLAKSVDSGVSCDGSYSLLAGQVKGTLTLENLYVKYDFNLDSPDIAKTNGQSTGLGLFEKLNAAPYIKNVIVDMSAVTNLKTTEADKPFAWGTISARYATTLDDSRISNLYIISDIPYLGRQHSQSSNTANAEITRLAVAGNDSAVLDSLTATTEKEYENAYRFADFNEAKEYFAQEANAGKLSLFSFVDTTDGYPFAGDKVAYIKNGTKLTLNNEEKTEYAMSASTTETINVALTYNGEQVTITQITHKEGSNLVTIDGNKVTYTAGGENDGFGAQTLTVSATIKDTVVTFDFEVIVNITESSAVVQYSTLNNSGVIPTELGNVTKIAKYSDKNAVIYDGTTWTAANVYQNSGETATETVADTTEDVVVYVNDVPTYKTSIESYSLVITKGSDLQYLRNTAYQSASDSMQGYFIVANDIDYETDPYVVEGDTNSFFGGVLDGQGYTVEFGVDKNGLLSHMGSNAEIKNISLVLKEITSSANYGVYPILAHGEKGTGGGYASARLYITDAYFAYDIPNFAPSTTWTNAQSNGIGLFGNTPAYVTYTNVVVDLSGVPALDYGYGAFGTWNANNVVYSTFTNTYVIYEKECLAYARNAAADSSFKDGYFAESDREAANTFATANNATISDSGSGTKNMLIVMKGVTRFDDAVAAMAYFKLEENAGKLEAFESFTDTSMGYPFVGDKATAIKNATTLTLNGEETTEYATSASTDATINVALTYNGEQVTITQITHKEGSNLVAIDGSTVTYTAGGENDGFGAQTLTVSATIQGVAVTFDIEVVVNIAESSAVVQYSTLNNSGVIPTELGNVTSIAKYSDKNAVIYDGTSWTAANVYQNSGETATETVADTTEDVVVYVDGLPAYKATIESYSLVITTGSDLDYLASSTATSASAALEGYFIVANDISYEKDPFVANPGSSCFGGTFDGQGHTIEYAVSAKGLFGKLCGPFDIKNASFVVKAVDNPETITGGKYAMLAQDFDISWGKRSTISNVYATYDIDGFTPNVTYNGSGLTSGVGLFSYAPSYITYTNVIVDMTNVTVDTEQANIHGYGAFGSNNATQPQYSTFVNTYVIWNNVYTTFKYATDRNNGYALTDKIDGITIAESDVALVEGLVEKYGLNYGGVGVKDVADDPATEVNEKVTYTLHVLKGLTRYDSYQAMVDAGKTTVGGFTISATGVTKA